MAATHSMQSLAFGLRNWVSMVLALFVAFWLQLGGASSAAACVGILALPTRGQAIQKAAFRVLGTVIGLVAAMVIAGLFNGERELFLVACGVWIGSCVYVAGLLDGNRAYGAVLSGYAVAIVAVAQIDSPLETFASGVNRGVAIVIGILSVAFVSDVFRASEVFPRLLDQLDAMCAASLPPRSGRGNTTR